MHGLTNEADTLLTQQARVTSDLQSGLMQTRMVPFQRHVPRLQRIVRQACADTGKQAELVVDGESNEIDRQVLESMLPPFEHLLRNAIAHGIEKPATRTQRGKPETGQVLLKIRREGSEVIIDVERRRRRPRSRRPSAARPTRRACSPRTRGSPTSKPWS